MIVTQILREEFPAQDNLFQSGFWGDFKTACNQQAAFFLCRSETLVEEFEKDFSFALLILFRKTKNNLTYAYVPKGPQISIKEEYRGLFLEELSLRLKPFLPEECVCIRYDLEWVLPFDKSLSVRPEMQEIRMNYGTKTKLLRKAPLDHFAPCTVIVNLSLPPENILSHMRQTTRNLIRKSYKSDNVFSIYESMDSNEDKEKLAEWYKIYHNTALRKDFLSAELSYFELLFKKQHLLKNAEEKHSLPLFAPAPDPNFYLFTAENDDKLLAGFILGIYGKSAYYMYAGTSEDAVTDLKHTAPNYGLQWEAMRFARMKGCTRYDLLGIPPNGEENHPMKGLYTFKTGLGGTPVKFCGCWDYPFIEDGYDWLRNSEVVGTT